MLLIWILSSDIFFKRPNMILFSLCANVYLSFGVTKYRNYKKRKKNKSEKKLLCVTFRSINILFRMFCPEKLQLPHPWKYSRPASTGMGATQSASRRCPCPTDRVWDEVSFKVPHSSNPNQCVILPFLGKGFPPFFF